MFKDFLKNSSEDRNLLCKRTTTPSVKSDLKTFQAQVRCGISNAIHEICHIIGIQLPSYFIVYVQVYEYFSNYYSDGIGFNRKNQISVFHNYKILYKAASTMMSKRSNSRHQKETKMKTISLEQLKFSVTKPESFNQVATYIICSFGLKMRCFDKHFFH